MVVNLQGVEGSLSMARFKTVDVVFIYIFHLHLWRSLLLQRVMPPVFEGFVALAVGILLGLLFLGQMTLAIRDHLAHMPEVRLIISRGVPIWVLLENINNLAAAVRIGRFKTPLALRHHRFYKFKSRSLVGICSSVPLVTDRLTRFAGPARLLGRFFLEPVAKLIGCHIHQLIELTGHFSLAARHVTR